MNGERNHFYKPLISGQSSQLGDLICLVSSHFLIRMILQVIGEMSLHSGSSRLINHGCLTVHVDLAIRKCGFDMFRWWLNTDYTMLNWWLNTGDAMVIPPRRNIDRTVTPIMFHIQYGRFEMVEQLNSITDEEFLCHWQNTDHLTTNAVLVHETWWLNDHYLLARWWLVDVWLYWQCNFSGMNKCCFSLIECHH